MPVHCCVSPSFLFRPCMRRPGCFFEDHAALGVCKSPVRTYNHGPLCRFLHSFALCPILLRERALWAAEATRSKRLVLRRRGARRLVLACLHPSPPTHGEIRGRNACCFVRGVCSIMKPSVNCVSAEQYELLDRLIFCRLVCQPIGSMYGIP